jgi:signal transduction histidine kinase/ligand-binding sensor domain-containing protein
VALAVALLTWSVPDAFAVDVSLPGGPREKGQYLVDTFGTDLGLPQTNVVTALQTRDGYLWVGTEGGLGRFDGTRFVAFRTWNTPAFLSHSIRCLFEDRDGSLWIGSERGLVRYRAGVFEHMGLPDLVVVALAQDRSGRIWIGTNGQGLVSFQGGQFRYHADDPAMPASAVRCLLVDSEDRLWVGFEKKPGVVCREEGRFQFYDGQGALDGEIYTICEHPRGTLWFGGRRGLARRRGGEFQIYRREAGLLSAQITDVRPALGGGLWVVASVLHKVTDLDRVVCVPISRIPTENARTVCEDREGNVWLCAQADGLIRVRHTYYRTLSMEDGLPGNTIKALSQDKDGNLWMAVQRYGVVRAAPDGAITVYAEKEGLPMHDPLSVCAARDGTVWVSSRQTLCSWRDGKWQVFPKFSGVRVMFEDRQGNMWFGSEERLLMRDSSGRFTSVKIASREITSVHTLAGDDSGALYVGTAPGSILKVKAGEVTLLKEGIGMPTGSVRAMYVDREERIWIGMKGRGLGVLAGGHWFNADALVEAVKDHVSAIAEDEHGQLWLGTPAGIMWAPKEELFAAARGTRATLAMRISATADGARAMSASSGTQPAVARSRSGEFLFATRSGVLMIDPDNVPPNGVAPPVHIEKVMVDGRPQPSSTHVVLSPATRQLSIEYTALSFVQPGRMLFKYKLEGYDADWVDAGARRLATYTNLPSGRYVFRVKACNSDGVWNERGDQIEIVRAPHFYETGWFFGVCAVVVAALAAAWHRWSHRQLKQAVVRLEQKQTMEKERRRIAKNLHDDLGANLTEIGLFAETARRKANSPEAIKDMAFLSERVRGLAESLDAVVWAVNPANDSLHRLSAYICGLFQDLFRLSPIRCRLDVVEELPAIPLTPEERSNLFLTAKEAINNILKHSGATEAWLRIRMDGEHFHLVIEDDGRGFDPASPDRANRNGLANMRSRIAELNGVFTIRSAPGQGTVLTISIHFAGRLSGDDPGSADSSRRLSAPSGPESP